ncbi:CRISPR-associated helicase Cas3' [Spirillospora sp. NPDC049652]
MTSDLWAHSRNPAGRRHALEDHLRDTAELAGRFGAVFGAADLAHYLGLAHDVGKGSCSWQDGLVRAEKTGGQVVDAGGRSIDHKSAGAYLAVREGHVGAFGLPVLGHHGGLPPLRQLSNKVADACEDLQVAEAIQHVRRLVPEIMGDRSSAVPAWAREPGNRHAAELLMRMVFSALVDADFLDTRRHREGALPDPVAWLADMVPLFEAGREKYLRQRSGGRGSAVGELRAEIYQQAVASASQGLGLFPFPAPTGGGKTLGVAGFAAHHAAKHGLRRVIVAVPYLSITEQNAEVYRQVFGAEHVLEHHSGVDFNELGPGQRWQRLAAENWDAPVVVTTTVRLFESLFSRKPAAMRRLHRLAGAVIVLDEVQSLPDPMLPPILSALRDLTRFFGSSVVLASATQPDFFGLEVFVNLQPKPVIAEPAPYYRKLQRVRYEWRCEPQPTFEEIAQDVAAETSCLAIVNTTKDAATLHRYVEELTEDVPVVHLSTRMASQHRRDALNEIRQRLKDKLPVLVVSTQLVEAGVDLDFPVAYRAFAPAEALQQAAGRVNREGLLDVGRVVVFDPSDGSTVGTRMVYGAALDLTRQFFGPELARPDDLDALSAYYRERYSMTNIEGAGPGAEIQKYRTEFDFPAVADRFRLIDERTVPVLVPYGDDAERKQLRRLLTAPEGPPAWVYRKIQQFLARLPRRLGEQAREQGMADLLVDGLYEWQDVYHPQRGIEFTDLNGEDLVF